MIFLKTNKITTIPVKIPGKRNLEVLGIFDLVINRQRKIYLKIFHVVKTVGVKVLRF